MLKHNGYSVSTSPGIREEWSEEGQNFNQEKFKREIMKSAITGLLANTTIVKHGGICVSGELADEIIHNICIISNKIAEEALQVMTESEPKPKRKRGRPRKNPSTPVNSD